MSQYKNASELSKLTLGKATEYASQYQPDLLQAVPRSLNRDGLNIDNKSLPFFGEDVWYGFEVSWLNDNGKPIVRVAEFVFPCTSPNIVESKSFKLYLNSFNQTRFSSEQSVVDTMIKDLSNTCGATASVNLYPVNNCPALAISPITAHCIDDEDIVMNDYQLTPSYLALDLTEPKTVLTESLVSHLLKSNCLITNQPDWASVYISYTGPKIDHAALLKYLVSFREHNEFHEQCVERIYCDIMQYCQPSDLSVYARYTRRGGLDINPFRASVDGPAPNARTCRQ